MHIYQELLVRLSRALDRAGVPYMVIGGQAVLRADRVTLTTCGGSLHESH